MPGPLLHAASPIHESRPRQASQDLEKCILIMLPPSRATGTNVNMMAGSEKPVSFGKLPVRIGFFEAWNGTIASAAMNTLLAVPQLQMAEATLLPDGKTSQEIFDIDAGGLEPAWTKLLASCPVAPSSVKPMIASPSPTSAPAR